MKTKDEIKAVLSKERKVAEKFEKNGDQCLDITLGWIEALEWVLGE